MNMEPDAAAGLQGDLGEQTAFAAELGIRFDETGQLYGPFSVPHMLAVFCFAFVCSSDHSSFFLLNLVQIFRKCYYILSYAMKKIQ